MAMASDIHCYWGAGCPPGGCPIRALLPPASESSPVKLLNIMPYYGNQAGESSLACAPAVVAIIWHYVKQRPLPSRPLLAGPGPPGPGPAQRVAPAL